MFCCAIIMYKYSNQICHRMTGKWPALIMSWWWIFSPEIIVIIDVNAEVIESMSKGVLSHTRMDQPATIRFKFSKAWITLGSDINISGNIIYRVLQTHTDKLGAGLSRNLSEDLPCLAVTKWIWTGAPYFSPGGMHDRAIILQMVPNLKQCKQISVPLSQN